MVAIAQPSGVQATPDRVVENSLLRKILNTAALHAGLRETGSP
jgi:hypothetical protein